MRKGFFHGRQYFARTSGRFSSNCARILNRAACIQQSADEQVEFIEQSAKFIARGRGGAPEHAVLFAGKSSKMKYLCRGD
ncbi:hypothetical protein FTUN_0794 [Frigoriglobus tundricola]|uniref:Uncharacterized protein n=1 Tax=Frigoriglobus tundricola TaxID=2774151 RepID=A0A6M5YH28_9BACT|nr:hypothetical protein FTUN_0794 [Frigoriglobus tundricola]